MAKKIDSLKSEGRKLRRHVMTTMTHDISLTFLCGISKKEEQLVAVEEARKMLLHADGNLVDAADALSDLRLKYRHLGCVGYSLSRNGNTKGGMKHV